MKRRRRAFLVDSALGRAVVPAMVWIIRSRKAVTTEEHNPFIAKVRASE